MADFTPTQGRYLAFIHAYTSLHSYPPAETEIAAAIGVSPPSVHLMVKMLEKKGLILRQPGQPRSLKILIPEEKIPPWNNRKQTNSPVQLDKQRVVTTPHTLTSSESLRRDGLSVCWTHESEIRKEGDQPGNRNPRRPDARATA